MDPQPDSKVVIVNVTTLRQNADQTLILRAGEHPFIHHDSVVNDADARIVEAKKLDSQANAGTIKLQKPCSLSLLGEVQKGILASDRTPNKVAMFCRRPLGKD